MANQNNNKNQQKNDKWVADAVLHADWSTFEKEYKSPETTENAAKNSLDSNVIGESNPNKLNQ